MDASEAPKKRGWPKGKKRKARDVRSEEEGRTPQPQKYTFMDDDDDDRLKVPAEMVPDGMSYQWVTDSIFGQLQPQRRARFERKGWTPVPAERHDGVFMPRGYKGEINVDGMVLMERPMELTMHARKKDEMRAREQVYIREQQLRGGDIGAHMAFDTQHETALRSNKINKTYERIPIPKE